jgi:outer membrane protein TolC
MLLLVGCGLVLAQAPIQPTTAPGTPGQPSQPVVSQMVSHSDPGALPLTLDQALAIAESNSEAITIVRARHEQAHGRVQEALSTFIPNLTASGTYTQFDESMTASFPAGVDQNNNQTFQSITIQPKTSKKAALTASLYMSSSVFAVLTAQKAGLSISEQEIRRVRQQLALDVKNAYYNVTRSGRLLDVAEEALRNAQQRLTLAQAQYAAGTVAQFDVIRAQTHVSQNQQNLLAAQNGLDLSKKALNNILARPINTPVALYDVTTLPTMDQALIELERVAVVNRPEIEEGRQNVKLQKLLVQVAQRSVLPSLVLSSTLNYDPEPSGFGGRKTSFVTVAVLSVPIFDGGLARGRVRQQRAEVEIAKANLTQLNRGVSLEVTQAYLNLANSKERLNTADSAVTEATESLRLSRIRYQSGVSILLEVSDAELAFTQAETNLVNARYDYLTAWAQLQKAIGQDVAVN